MKIMNINLNNAVTRRDRVLWNSQQLHTLRTQALHNVVEAK